MIRRVLFLLPLFVLTASTFGGVELLPDEAKSFDTGSSLNVFASIPRPNVYYMPDGAGGWNMSTNPLLAAITVPSSIGIDQIATDAFTAVTPVVAGAIVIGAAILGVVIVVKLVFRGPKKVAGAAGK